MKTVKRFALFSLVFFLNPLLFAVPSAKEKAFVKGSISDKIAILRNLSESEAVPVAKKGLDFAVEQAGLLGSDAEFVQLVTASVRSIPSISERIRKIPKTDQQFISERLMTIFKLFPNTEVKSAVLERLPLYTGDDKSLTVDFLNDYLASAFKAGEKAENVLESAIVTIGKIGNSESLSIIYNIWVSKIWMEYQKSTDEALVLLSQDSFSDAIKIFSISNIDDSAHYFSLLKKSSQISQNSLCEVAENALLIAINNAEKLKAQSKTSERSFLDFQWETQEVLTSHKWSHAANVVNLNVKLAKSAYDAGKLGEVQFIRFVQSSVAVPSPALAQSLTEMLSECNGTAEKASKGESAMPAKSVVLALISALGDLGDKTAFDTLLYVTYLSYPIEVIDEAKRSLAKLNW